MGKDEIAAAVEQVLTEGMTVLRQAFAIEWVTDTRDDIEAAFAEASARSGGVVPRGPQRYYVEIHPQQFRGFVDLMTHPWVTGVCEGVLGPEWTAVELGFDIYCACKDVTTSCEQHQESKELPCRPKT